MGTYCNKCGVRRLLCKHYMSWLSHETLPTYGFKAHTFQAGNDVTNLEIGLKVDGKVVFKVRFCNSRSTYW